MRQAALSSGLLLVDMPEAAATRLDLLDPQSATDNQQSSIWIYALVTPFPSTVDNVSFADLQAAWGGGGTLPRFAVMDDGVHPGGAHRLVGRASLEVR